MTEPFEGAEEAPSGNPRPAAAAPTTAGGLIRAARERQGLHIAALATAIKVSPRKLDALENDRYAELPDATFTRALAQTVCKTLKLPAGPVLALLPAAESSALDHVAGALNEPFRDRPGREEHAALAAVAVRPMVWMGLAFLLAAMVLFFAPASWWQRLEAVDSAASAASAAPVLASAPAAPVVAASAASAVAMAASAPAAAASAVVAASAAATTLAAPVVPAAVLPAQGPAALSGAAQVGPARAPAPTAAVPAVVVGGGAPAAAPVAPLPTAAAPATAAPLAPVAAGAAALQLQADQATWAEVRDARGQVLVSRLVRAGEVLQLSGTPPLKLTLGNAPGTRLSFRGKPVDLVPFTRDSVARFELQ
ncbi:MAG: helix-turn-helix domain-containing protein [Rubrivivax sp.]|jgi:cytoskeleton protein RodZ